MSGRAKRASTAAATKASTPAKRSRHTPQPTPYGITDDQHRRLCQSVAAELKDPMAEAVVSKLVEAGVIPVNRSASGQNDNRPPPETVPVLEQPPASTSGTGSAVGEIESAAAAATVHALSYGESAPKLNPANLMSTPLAYHVNDRLKEKVVTDKYVDLKTLLPGNDNPGYTLKVDSSGNEPSIHLASTAPTKSLSNIESWLTAFEIYHDIYIEAHPTKSPQLVKYQNKIRALNRKFGFQTARYYDENFRLLRETNPDLDFAISHSEIWMTATTMHSQNPNQNSNFRPKSQSTISHTARTTKLTPPGFCFAYHTQGVRCDKQPCKYNHFCFQCRGPHPIFKCLGTNSRQKPLSTAHPQVNSTQSKSHNSSKPN